jgi:TonB family C-terminal domain
VRRAAILSLTVLASVFASPMRLAVGADGKCLAIYAPRPEYPHLADFSRPEGTGLFICQIDVKSGQVTSVSIAKSTRHASLDRATVDCLRRWRFTPGACSRVKIPITFSRYRPS